MISDLYSVRPGDLFVLGEKMGRAFETDPVCRFIYPGAQSRRSRARYFYEFVMRTGLVHGEIYAPSAALEGVACWLPPGKEHVSLIGYLRAGALRAIWQNGASAFWRINRTGDILTERHQRYAPEPHYYLSFLGVDPDHQKQGFAGKLLRPMFERFDQEGAGCYLETHKSSSAELYRRYGFDVVDESAVEGTDMIQWSMLRPPR